MLNLHVWELSHIQKIFKPPPQKGHFQRPSPPLWELQFFCRGSMVIFWNCTTSILHHSYKLCRVSSSNTETTYFQFITWNTWRSGTGQTGIWCHWIAFKLWLFTSKQNPLFVIWCTPLLHHPVRTCALSNNTVAKSNLRGGGQWW